MPAKYLRWLLTAALVLAVVQVIVAGAFAVGAPLVGQPLTTSWNIVSDQSREAPVAIDQGEAKARIYRGELLVEPTNWRASVLKLLDVALTGGLTVGALWLLRRFVDDIDRRRPFTPRGAARLRTIGLLILAIPLWQVIEALLWQGFLMSIIQKGDPTFLPVFAKAGSGGETLRLIPQISLGLAFAGLIVMVVGEAFRAAAVLQRDSDEIV